MQFSEEWSRRDRQFRRDETELDWRAAMALADGRIEVLEGCRVPGNQGSLIAELRMEQYVRRLVREAPPLNPSQYTRLARLLSPAEPSGPQGGQGLT